MTNESAILNTSALSQSTAVLPDYMPPEEMYRVTRGISKDWGMEHYDPPKKAATYHRTKYSFPQAMRRTMSELKQRLDTNVPGPGKYEKETKYSLISTIHRPLFRAAKNSFITDIMRAPARPGPGAYFQTQKGKFLGDLSEARRVRGPVIDKSFGHNFVSESQYLGEQSPGPGSYETSILSHTSPFTRNSPAFQKPKQAKHTKTADPGPGHYYRKDYRHSPKDPRALCLASALIRTISLRSTPSRATRRRSASLRRLTSARASLRASPASRARRVPASTTSKTTRTS